MQLKPPHRVEGPRLFGNPAVLGIAAGGYCSRTAVAPDPPAQKLVISLTTDGTVSREGGGLWANFGFCRLSVLRGSLPACRVGSPPSPHAHMCHATRGALCPPVYLSRLAPAGRQLAAEPWRPVADDLRAVPSSYPCLCNTLPWRRSSAESVRVEGITHRGLQTDWPRAPHRIPGYVQICSLHGYVEPCSLRRCRRTILSRSAQPRKLEVGFCARGSQSWCHGGR